MEQERIVLLAGLLFTVAVGIFILWGPSNLTRKRKKGYVGGLVNLGHSCFLNTLLQAFGSCPHILNWLSRHNESKGLIAALRLTLQVINGEHADVKDDPYAPCEVLDALRSKWNISPGEQDAHELFVVVISALEDEIQHATLPRVCSLSDALDCPSTMALHVANSHVNRNGRPLVPLSDTGEPREVHSEVATSGMTRHKHTQQRHTASLTSNLSSAPLPREIVLPFQGLLTSSLQCTKCSYKNVQCDKFDSLSLPLPGERERRHTLMQLIESFVATETVRMNCDKCKMSQVDVHKTFNFGKLPGCLCIHIVRTTWLPDGRASKRLDHVDFPEVLVMDNYTYAKTDGDTSKQRYVYELKAVVVHRGDLNQGHFITYRRSKYSWVLISDADVIECSKEKALGDSAYMLFYDKI